MFELLTFLRLLLLFLLVNTISCRTYDNVLEIMDWRRQHQRAVKTVIAILACSSLVLLSRTHEGLAQRLSFHHYNVGDGLAHLRVTSIHQDKKGYLWLGTWEGLSRFDGYRFVNYGTRDLSRDAQRLHRQSRERRRHL